MSHRVNNAVLLSEMWANRGKVQSELGLKVPKHPADRVKFDAALSVAANAITFAERYEDKQSSLDEFSIKMIDGLPEDQGSDQVHLIVRGIKLAREYIDKTADRSA